MDSGFLSSELGLAGALYMYNNCPLSPSVETFRADIGNSTDSLALYGFQAVARNIALRMSCRKLYPNYLLGYCSMKHSHRHNKKKEKIKS